MRVEGKLLRLCAMLGEIFEKVIGLLVQPAAILREVEKDQPLDEQLRFAECLRPFHALVFAQVGFDGFDVLVELFEELRGERFLEGVDLPLISTITSIFTVLDASSPRDSILYIRGTRRLRYPGY